MNDIALLELKKDVEMTPKVRIGERIMNISRCCLFAYHLWKW